MNKTYTVTINNLTESDMRDIFYEAIEKLKKNRIEYMERCKEKQNETR